MCKHIFMDGYIIFTSKFCCHSTAVDTCTPGSCSALLLSTPFMFSKTRKAPLTAIQTRFLTFLCCPWNLIPTFIYVTRSFKLYSSILPSVFHSLLFM